MSIRSRALAAARAGMIAVMVVGSWSGVVGAQQKTEKKLDKSQQEDARTLTQVLDQAQAGGGMPADVPVAIESYHYFKAANGGDYVPFTMTVDAANLPSSAVSVMLRVVKKDAAVVQQTPRSASAVRAGDRGPGDSADLAARIEEEHAKAQADKGKLPPLAPPTFQDLYFVDVRPLAAGQPGRLARAFQVPSGDYDVYVAVKERTPADKKKPKIGVCKQTFSLPGLATQGDLTTSSVILTTKAEELKAQLTPDQQRERPYAIGAIEVVPTVGTKFAKVDQLQIFFQIYNYTLVEGNKPDVMVEYNFYRKLEGGEKYFNKTEPDILNASAVHPMFDGTKHQLPAGPNLPLKSFPAGDYRLEIKVTDRPSGKSVIRNLEFSVF